MNFSKSVLIIRGFLASISVDKTLDVIVSWHLTSSFLIYLGSYLTSGYDFNLYFPALCLAHKKSSRKQRSFLKLFYSGKIEASIQKLQHNIRKVLTEKIYTATYTHTGGTTDINIRGQGKLSGRRDFS